MLNIIHIYEYIYACSQFTTTWQTWHMAATASTLSWIIMPLENRKSVCRCCCSGICHLHIRLQLTDENFGELKFNFMELWTCLYLILYNLADVLVIISKYIVHIYKHMYIHTRVYTRIILFSWKKQPFPWAKLQLLLEKL